MKILLAGGSGLLGGDLKKELLEAGHAVEAPESGELDLRDIGSIERALGARPDWIINAAARINVDADEEDPDTAYAVNAYGAAELARPDIPHIFISSNYVFGDEKDAYTEADPPHPINVYGASKAKGEELIIKKFSGSTPPHFVIRTSWLFSPRRKTYVDQVIIALRAGEEVRTLDQRGNFTYAPHLARKITSEFISRPPESGTYHLTNASARQGVSRYEAALEIARIVGAPRSLVVKTEQVAVFKAQRPEHAVLVNTKCTPLPSWQDALREFVGEYYP